LAQTTVAAPVAFKPYVADEANLPELTLRALVLGAILGVVFGASSVYLGLRVGLTVSASIPIAVISITVLRRLSKVLGSQASILENNIVQTAGSAGESIAGGVIFTIPALIFLGFELDWTRTMVLALMGGILGVLLMIPLRRYLIVKEHGVLKYPEGTACAEVLIVGEEGGTQAGLVFKGLFAGAIYKFLNLVLALWNEFPERFLNFYQRTARLRLDCDPALLGVGYIIGYRSSALMVGGGLLASLVLIPAITLFGEGRSTFLYPATMLISDMGPDEIWSNYIRYIGAGAVAAGGIINLVRALPTIVDSFAASFRDLRKSGTGEGVSTRRTEHDIPITFVLVGAVALALAMTLVPQLRVNLLAAFLIIVFGFFFSVVSSRITGELGSSSCPISGMAIATLMGTCGIFLLLGWTGHGYTAAALSVGAVVCIAASNAGTTSQDLKTGYLVGATPWKQQVALIIGVLATVFVVGWTVIALNRSLTKVVPTNVVATVPTDSPERLAGPDGVQYRVARAHNVEGVPNAAYLVDDAGQVRYQVEEGIGSKEIAAPQARLMSLVIEGILTRQLPWGLVLIGVFISVLLEIVGVPALAFAVGVYLPLESTTPVYFGGLVSWLVQKRSGVSAAEGDSGPGVLYSSGLIAGGSLMGLAYAILQPEKFAHIKEALNLGKYLPPWVTQGSAVGLITFLIITWLLYRAGRSGEGAVQTPHA
jgi:putative OPT family oligopeptide transporter